MCAHVRIVSDSVTHKQGWSLVIIIIIIIILYQKRLILKMTVNLKQDMKEGEKKTQHKTLIVNH